MKKIFTFFSPGVRISGKNINFGDKEINKSNFYENKKLFKIEDIDINKILASKKNYMVGKIHLNISLDIMMMISLDHYL